MKTYAVLFSLALTTSAVAQQANSSSAKPFPEIHIIQQSGGLLKPTMAQPPAPKDAKALPVGTAIRMKLHTALFTASARRGDHFNGSVAEPVTLNGRTIIPVGAAVEGTVVRSEEHRRIAGLPTLKLRPELITLPDGSRYSISASIVDTSDPHNLDVNEEGEIKGRGHDKTDLIETGAAAGTGVTIGALAGGPPGALIGGGIGATASFVHWLTKTKSTYVPSGTELIMELSRPMQLTMAEAGD